MSADDPRDLRVAQLRQDLKSWEKSFAAANGGRKAGRDDIKNDATISAKYKEYESLRRKPAIAQTTPRKPAKPQSRKKDGNVLTERSANAIAATPKRGKEMQSLQAPVSSVVAEEEPTPAAIRCALGPTPQKDGEILGLFDLLPEATPSRRDDAYANTSMALVSATPSKSAPATSSDPQLSRTPQSSGKRFFLGAFAGTPLKRKREDDGHTPSTAKRQFATPSFLRRSFPLAPIGEDDQEASFAAPQFKRRGLVRSLSTIIQGLKKQEEQKMDDDWDIMNELEAEERGETEEDAAPKVLVEDSQAAEMPLGPDKGAESSEDEGAVDRSGLDVNGNPRKVWKKKGLKRQTRRVIMRPVTHKPKKAVKDAHPKSDDSESEHVEETQLPGAAKLPAGEDVFDDEDDAETTDSKHDSQQSHYEPSGPKQKKRKKTNAANEDSSKKPKKTSALAHANFRKLKIKNKNSKANGRGGRKFGRR